MPAAGSSALRRRLRPRRLALMAAALPLASITSAFAADPAARAVPGRNQHAETSVPAEASTEMCIDSHTQSQLLRRDEKLIESRSVLVSCSSAACPSALRRDCALWLEEVEKQIPSVGFRASMAGEEEVDVQVFVDEKLILERLQGKAVELNPGAYRVRFVPPKPFEPLEQELVMSQGEQFRIVTVEFERPPESTQPAAETPTVLERPTPTASYVFAGIGAAAAISGAAWGLSTWAGTGELEANCAPGCPGKTVDIVRQRALLADISWGVSAASFITAAAFYFLRPEVPMSETTLDIALIDGGVRGAVQIAIP